ncbi:LytTR family DNA-binding domain-containing protein [Filimonas zeae]|nr:LytTR family DNA-binding domain-containing protein [Filimonas zeae]
MPRLYLPQYPRYVCVEQSNIMLIEGGKIYSTVITTTESILIRKPLTQLHQTVGYVQFCRVHTAYVVSLDHIVFFTAELINLGSREVPIGRTYREAFYKRITFLGE